YGASIGSNANEYGVLGKGDSGGVKGCASGTDCGLLYGLLAYSNYGVYGRSSSSTAITNRGVYGYASSATNDNIGVYGYALGTSGTNNYGLYGYASGSGTLYGIYAYAPSTGTNLSGYFVGNVQVTGTLSKGSGSFLIDHPLDPKNKVLRHSFAESPEMLNIYKGNAKTAGRKKVIQMPEWFVALNGKDSSDYSFAVTPLKSFCGGYYVDNSEIASKGRFTVVTEKDCEFSWVVYAVRHDAFALKNPVIVEQSKEDANLGSDCYLSPQAFGASEKEGCEYQREHAGK
ncbi:MAG: hypothetical protein AB1626_05275, partial [Candidatus Micrarchaeota archaeon]